MAMIGGLKMHQEQPDLIKSNLPKLVENSKMAKTDKILSFLHQPGDKAKGCVKLVERRTYQDNVEKTIC